MKKPADFRPLGCSECLKGVELGFDFSMALQPIIDVQQRKVFAHEALVRGQGDDSAAAIMQQVDQDNRYSFDQICRVKALKLASELQLDGYLSINFMPNAVYRPELCIRTTLQAAEEFGFPADKIIFEITEGEEIDDHAHLRNIIQHYQRLGFLTALDDFGAGYSGLNLLAEFQTDLLKLDMGLARGVDTNPARLAIIKGTVQTCHDLGIRVIAEGVETQGEYQTLRELGIDLFQGFLFARPALEAVPEINWDMLDAA